MLRRVWFFAVAVLTPPLLSCEQPPSDLKPFVPSVEQKEYGRQLPPGALALRKIGPEDYPDFRPGFDKSDALRRATEFSLSYLAKPSSQRYYPYGDVPHARAVASLRHFLRVLDSVNSPDEFDAAIRRDFEVYQSVGWDDRGTVFYTGYYTPIFEGRRQRDSRFRYPLYRLPPDLVKDAEGQTLGRRTGAGSFTPGYPSRREIEEGRLLDGLEVAYVKSAFEAYVIHVQGSAKLRMADGSILELGYAGNNGHEYTPVAAAMIQDGEIRREDLSLQTLLEYFAKNAGKTFYYTWKNERFVFFQELPGGPFGSIGVPVTPFRSIATDKSIFPRACMAYLVTTLPRLEGGAVVQRPYAGFALDQDTGGAIRAPGRCDVFMGVGAGAEAVAGRTGSEGELFYIFVKPGVGGGV